MKFYLRCCGVFCGKLYLRLAGAPKSVLIKATRDTAIKTHNDTVKATIFGGRKQYRTWSIVANVGILSPFVATGGSNNFTNPDLEVGYDISVHKQLAPAFSLQFNTL